MSEREIGRKFDVRVRVSVMNEWGCECLCLHLSTLKFLGECVSRCACVCVDVCNGSMVKMLNKMESTEEERNNWTLKTQCPAYFLISAHHAIRIVRSSFFHCNFLQSAQIAESQLRQVDNLKNCNLANFTFHDLRNILFATNLPALPRTSLSKSWWLCLSPWLCDATDRPPIKPPAVQDLDLAFGALRLGFLKVDIWYF